MRTTRPHRRGHAQKKPKRAHVKRRKSNKALRARVCSWLTDHYGDGREIVKQARIIIHYIDTAEDWPSEFNERPGLRLIDRGQ